MKKHRPSLAVRSLIVLSIIFTLSSCGNKGPKNLDKLMAKYEEEGQKRRSNLYSPFSGTILVARDGSVIFKKAYGYADREEMIESHPDDRYPIASLTKQFTAMLTLQLVESGQLDLEANIGHYLPYLSAGFADSVTLHHLLSHTSGLPHYEGLEARGIDLDTFNITHFTPEQLTAVIEKVDLVDSPGNSFTYSSLGYLLLGTVLEEVSGKTYADLLNSLITGPLGMDNTGFASNEFIASETVPGYRFSRNGGIELLFSKYHGHFRKARFRDQSTLYSTGGIHSTVDDLFKWSEAVRNEHILPAAMSEKMMEVNKQGYSYGWVRNHAGLAEKNLAAPHYMHTGDLDGHSAFIALYDDGTTIICLANLQPLNDDELIHQLFLASHGREDEFGAPPLPNTRTYSAFQSSGGMQAFNEHYRQIEEFCGYDVTPGSNVLNDIMFFSYTHGDSTMADSIKNVLLSKTDFSEGLFNQIGYRFLGRRDCPTALEFFSANAERYPASSNVWDSQGDGFMACEEFEKAAESYREAIRIGELNDHGNLGLYKENLETALGELEVKD